MIKLNSVGEPMEGILTVVIAFVMGGFIGQKLGRERTDLQLRKSACEWKRVKIKNKKPSPGSGHYVME